MTIRRWQGILLGLLLIQVLLVALVYWPRQGAQAGLAEPLLEGDITQRVVQMTIQDSEENAVRLLHEAQAWVLPDAGDYPADDEKINAFLEKLAAVTTGSSVATSPDSHQRLQVAERDFERKVDLALEGGRHTVLYLGSSPNFGAIHIRREGDDVVYLTTEVAAFDAAATADAWIDPVYVSIQQEEVRAVTIQNSSGEWTLVRMEEGEWSLTDLSGDETVDQSAVTSLLNRVTVVRMTEPVSDEMDASYGFDEPSAEVTVRTAEETFRWKVGALDTQGEAYYVKSDASAYVVKVSATNVEPLLTNAREDVLLPPATPTTGIDENSP